MFLFIWWGVFYTSFSPSSSSPSLCVTIFFMTASHEAQITHLHQVFVCAIRFLRSTNKNIFHINMYAIPYTIHTHTHSHTHCVYFGGSVSTEHGTPHFQPTSSHEARAKKYQSKNGKKMKWERFLFSVQSDFIGSLRPISKSQVRTTTLIYYTSPLL